jgi:hypothetical protein
MKNDENEKRCKKETKIEKKKVDRQKNKQS